MSGICWHFIMYCSITCSIRRINCWYFFLLYCSIVVSSGIYCIILLWYCGIYRVHDHIFRIVVVLLKKVIICYVYFECTIVFLYCSLIVCQVSYSYTIASGMLIQW